MSEYRGMLWELREHEGWRAYRWPVLAAALTVAVWVPPLVGGVGAAYFIGDGSLLSDTIGTVITLALGALGQSWAARRPWYGLLANRVAAYSDQADPRDYSRALIPEADFHAATHALRRSGLNCRGGRIPSTPPDAPTLDCQLYVYRPGICVRPGQRSVSEQTRHVLAQSGIDARVDGLLPNGDPIPIVSSVST